jgi:hypothetical protein
MNNIPKPEISSDFTIEDIHKIREWHYEVYKGMTPEEICEYTRTVAERFEQRLKEPGDPAIEAEIERLLQSVRKPVKVTA